MCDDQDKRAQDQDFNEKGRIYYGAMINAWLTTKLEADKSLLSLSVFAIGLLVTLATTIGIHGWVALFAAFIATVAFVACIHCILEVFKFNAAIVISNIKNDQELSEKTKSQLKRLDLIAAYAFKLGVLALVVMAAAITYTYKKEEEKSMTQKTDAPQGITERVNVRDGWGEISELKPTKPTPQSAPEKSEKKEQNKENK